MVELWDLGRQAVEQVVGRAASRTVAESIFRAAVAAQPGRRVVLRRGQSVLRES